MKEAHYVGPVESGASMKRGRISSEQAEQMLQSFRERPGIASAAAKAAGVDPRTAKMAWDKGLRGCYDEKYHTPFRERINQERIEARARMETEEKNAAELAAKLEAERRAEVLKNAQKDATDSRVQEATMVRMARSGVIVLLNTLAQVSAGASTVGKKVRTSLEEIGNDPSRELTLKETVSLTQMLNRLTTALRQANDAAQKAMEMERLLLGEPTNITAHVQLEPVTAEEAREKIAQVERTLRTLEAEGVKTVDGSAASTDPTFN